MNTRNTLIAALAALLMAACGGGESGQPIATDAWRVPTSGTPKHISCSAEFENTGTAPKVVSINAIAQRALFSADGRLGAQTFVTHRVTGDVFSAVAGIATHDGAVPGAPLLWSDSVDISISVPAGSRLNVEVVAAIIGVVKEGAVLETAGCSIVIV